MLSVTLLDRIVNVPNKFVAEDKRCGVMVLITLNIRLGSRTGWTRTSDLKFPLIIVTCGWLSIEEPTSGGNEHSYFRSPN